MTYEHIRINKRTGMQSKLSKELKYERQSRGETTDYYPKRRASLNILASWEAVPTLVCTQKSIIKGALY